MTGWDRLRALRRQLAHLGDGLTRPAAALTDEGDRHQARLLAALLLVVLTMGTYIGVVPYVVEGRPDAVSATDLAASTLGLLALGGVYGLSRTRHYRYAARAMVLVMTLTIFFISIPQDDAYDVNLHIYLIVPVLVSSVFLSVRETGLLIATNTALMAAFPLLFDTVTPDDMWIGFVSMTSVTILFLMRYNTMLERDRRAALVELSERYRRLVEMAPVAIAVHSQGRIKYINPAGLRMLGASSFDEINDLPILDLIDPAYHDIVVSRILKSQVEGRTQPAIHERFRRLDGSTIDVELATIPFSFEGETATQIVAYDITASKRATDALRASEQHNRALLAAIPDLMFHVDRAGRYLDVRAEGKEHLLSHSVQELIGHSMTEFMDAGQAAAALTIIDQVLTSGKPDTFEYTLPVDGAPHVFEGRMAAIDADTALILVRDITERVHAEDALRDSEQRNRALIAAMPDLMFRVGRDGRYLDARAEGREDMLVVPVEEVIGATIYDFFDPAESDQMLNLIEQVLATGEMAIHEYTLDVPIGTRIFEARMVPCGPDDVLYVSRDITHRKQTEEALRRRDDILQALADVSERLLHPGNLDQRLPNVLARLGRAVDVHRVSMWDLSNHSNGDIWPRLHSWWSRGGYEHRTITRDTPLAVTDRIAPWLAALRDGQPVQSRATDLFGSAPGTSSLPPIKALLALPLHLEGRLWGVLTFEDSETERTWPETEVTALRSVGGVLGAAIARQRSEQVVREQRDVTEALRSAATTLTSTLDSQQIIERLLETLGQIVPHDAANVMRINPKQHTARVVGSRGYEAHGTADRNQDLVIQLGGESYFFAQQFETYDPVVINDTHTDPRWVIIPGDEWIRAFATVPLRVHGELIGLLNLDSATPNHFTAQHVERLRIYANQAAVALNNARLYRAERENRRLAEALHAAATALTSTLDPETVIERLLESLAHVVPYEAANVMGINWDTRRLRILGCRGYDRLGLQSHYENFDISLDDPYYVNVGTWLEQDEAVLFSDTHADPNWTRIPGNEWIRSLVSAPIKLHGRQIGLINLDSTQPGHFTDTHRTNLSLFADQAAVALYNAQLFSAERAQREMAEALHDAAATLTSTLDLTTVIEQLLAALARAVPHDAANIMRIEPELGMLRIIGARGYEAYGTAERNRRLMVPIENFTGKKFATEGPLIINDTHNDPRWRKVPGDEWIRSYAMVSIRLHGDIIGYLNVDCAIPFHFTQEHVSRLKAFTEQAAVALNNARLYAAEHEQRQFAEALHETVSLLNQTLDPERVLDHILVSIGRVVKHDAANIMLIDGDTLRMVRHRGYEAHQLGQWTSDFVRGLHQRATVRHVLETRQPLLIDDTQTEALWQHNEHTSWIRSSVITPIVIDDEVLGLMITDAGLPHTFTRQDANRLQAFAAQAAVAIANARLYEETRQTADELAILYQGTSFLFTTLPPNAGLHEVAEQIMQTVVRTFDYADCGLLVVDRDAGELVPVGRRGAFRVNYRGTRLRIDSVGLIPLAARSRATVYAPDVSQHPNYLQGEPRTRSELAVPMMTANGVIGVLDLQSDQPDAFSARDQRILTAFAERAAAAVENRQLYLEVQRYANELEQRVALRTVDLSLRNAVAEMLSSSLESVDVLDRVLQVATEHLAVSGGAIHLLGSASGELVLKAHHGVSAEQLQQATGFADRDNAPLADSFWLGVRSEALPPAPGAPDHGIASVLSVPIWRQDQVQGVITLVNATPRTWTSEETRLLDAMGRQIGVALANIDLYDKAVNAAARIRTILQGAADGILVFDQDDALMLINPAAESLMRFYPPVLNDPGAATQAATWLWEWLRTQTANAPGTNSDAPDTVEFVLPVQSPGGVMRASLNCDLPACPRRHAARPDWPCWLLPGGIGATDVEECALYRSVAHRAIQARSAVVHDDDGAALGTVIVLHDVTYYRDLDELKERFVSTVSHELRTPLSTLLLQVSTLLKYYERFGDDERLNMLREMQGQTQALRELVEDILHLSRFDAHHSQPQLKWFDLARQSQELIDGLLPVLHEKELTLTTDGLSGLCYVHADSKQILRVLRNLLSNAVKYTPPGGQITVRLRTDGGTVHLSVQDTGIGIPPEDQVYIFDRFYRADNAAHMAAGTGLGLAISQEIAVLHGGRIDLKSVPEVGSTFTLVLPLPDSAASAIEL